MVDQNMGCIRPKTEGEIYGEKVSENILGSVYSIFDTSDVVFSHVVAQAAFRVTSGNPRLLSILACTNFEEAPSKK